MSREYSRRRLSGVLAFAALLYASFNEQDTTAAAPTVKPAPDYT